MQIIRKGFLNILIVFTFLACAQNDVTFDSKSKKGIKDSWDWKIFIFTAEGEFEAIPLTNNKFDDTLETNPIFAEDVLEVYNEDLFLNNQNMTFSSSIAFA